MSAQAVLMRQGLTAFMDLFMLIFLNSTSVTYIAFNYNTVFCLIWLVFCTFIYCNNQNSISALGSCPETGRRTVVAAYMTRAAIG